jgi:hypothetical protein
MHIIYTCTNIFGEEGEKMTGGRRENICLPSVSVLAILHVLRFRPTSRTTRVVSRLHVYCTKTDRGSVTVLTAHCCVQYKIRTRCSLLQPK